MLRDFFKTLTNYTFSAGLIMKVISFSTNGSPSLYRNWKLSNKTTPCCGQSRDGRLSGIILSACNLTKIKVNDVSKPRGIEFNPTRAFFARLISPDSPRYTNQHFTAVWYFLRKVAVLKRDFRGLAWLSAKVKHCKIDLLSQRL